MVGPVPAGPGPGGLAVVGPVLQAVGLALVGLALVEPAPVAVQAPSWRVPLLLQPEAAVAVVGEAADRVRRSRRC